MGSPRSRPPGVLAAEGLAIAWSLLCCCGLGSLVTFLVGTNEGTATVLLAVGFSGAMLVPVGAALASIRRVSFGREVLLAFHGLAGPLMCCSTFGTVPQFVEDMGRTDGAMLLGQFVGGCLFPIALAFGSMGGAIYLATSKEAKAWYAAPRDNALRRR